MARDGRDATGAPRPPLCAGRVGGASRAGQRAVARSAVAEAITQLKKGLELLTSLPDGVARQRQELQLQIALGRALLVSRGYAAPTVGETYARARALCERLDRPPEIVPVLYGQCLNHLINGPLPLAREIAADLLQRGEDGADVPITMMGHRVSGLTCFFLGEFLASRAHLEQALARFDPAHGPFYMSFDIQDPLVTLLNFLSRDLFCLGYLDDARLRIEVAVEEASKLGHAFSVAIALSGACWVDWAMGSHEELLARANALIAVSDEHGFPWQRAVGTVYRG